MFDIEALPLLRSYSESDRADERALFVRVYLDVIADCRRHGLSAPADWAAALQICLAKAQGVERQQYEAVLGAALRAAADIAREIVKPTPPAALEERHAHATREDIDAILGQGSLDRWIALARDRAARLRPEHMERLVARAREALVAPSDPRLAQALLSREPVRLEAAPLFLEATPEQRSAILLAAQRAELGRRAAAPLPRLDGEATSRLEFAAIAGEGAEFAGLLAAALGADDALAARMTNDPQGEPLALALVALGVARDVCVRILTARDMENGETYPRLQALTRISNQISVGAARRVVAAIVGAPTASPAALPAAASRTAVNPSPFARREGSAAARRDQPRNDRNVGAR